MGISSANITRAQCDACPTKVYAEPGEKPKGFTGHVQHVDGNGKENNARWFACQPNHVGKAVANALKEAAGRASYAAPVTGGIVTYGEGSDSDWQGHDADPDAAQG